MLSNYHASSQAPGPDPGPAHYTLAGFDNDLTSSSNNKKSHRRAGNFFSRGKRNKKQQKLPGGSISDVSTDQSLTYSTSSSLQSAGQSTDSSQFSNILKVLDVQDGKELAKLKRGLSIGSNVSSLNYSTDGESHQDSHLEGSTLMQNIPGPDLLGNFDKHQEDEEPFDMMFQPAATPPRSKNRKKPITKADNKEPSTASRAATVEREKPLTKPEQPTAAPEAPAVARQASIKKSIPKTSEAKSFDQEETKHDDNINPWKCDLLEESLPDSVPKSLNAWKTILRPYLCFL